MTSDLMLAIKTIIIVSPNWRKVLKLFRQTEVCCANQVAIDSASLDDYGDLFIRPVHSIEKRCARLVRETPFIHSAVKSGNQVLKLVR